MFLNSTLNHNNFHNKHKQHRMSTNVRLYVFPIPIFQRTLHIWCVLPEAKCRQYQKCGNNLPRLIRIPASSSMNEYIVIMSDLSANFFSLSLELKYHKTHFLLELQAKQNQFSSTIALLIILTRRQILIEENDRCTTLRSTTQLICLFKLIKKVSLNIKTDFVLSNVSFVRVKK